MDYGQGKEPAKDELTIEEVQKLIAELTGEYPDEMGQRIIKERLNSSGAGMSSGPKTPDHPASSTGQQPPSPPKSPPSQLPKNSSKIGQTSMQQSMLMLPDHAAADFLTSQWNKGVHEGNESNPFPHDDPEAKKRLARKRLIEKDLIPAMGTTNSTKEDWDVWNQKREEKELRKENQKIGARELRQKKEAREEQKKKEAEAAKAKTEAEAKAKAEKATAKRNAWAENHVKRKYADTKSSVKSANKEEFKKTLKNGFEEQLSKYKRAENKRSLLKRAWSRITHPFLSKEQRAIKQFAKDYDFDMRRHRSGKFGKVLDSFFKKRDYSIEKLQKQYTKAFIKENNEMLREQGAMEKTGRNSLHVLSDKMKERGGRISKPGGKGFFGGKGGKVAMMAGLVGLGAVISNMFSGGHQSNSQLYNPNPQPQYYS